MLWEEKEKQQEKKMKSADFDNDGTINGTVPELKNEILNTTITKFKRICPICKNTIFYKFRQSFWLSQKQNACCRKCNSAKRIGIHRPIEVKQKISNSMMGEKNHFYGKHHSNETKQILSVKCGHLISNINKELMSKRFFGKNNPFYGHTHSNKTKKEIALNTKKCQTGRIKSLEERKNISHALSGLPKSLEHRRKIGLLSKARIIERKEKEGILRIGYNPTACEYFNRLNIINNWNLKHALNGGEKRVLCYFLDAYDIEKNIVVEYDECHHYDIYGRLKSKDIQRMNDIINVLGCRFYRYNALKKELCEYDKHYEVVCK